MLTHKATQARAPRPYPASDPKTRYFLGPGPENERLRQSAKRIDPMREPSLGLAARSSDRQGSVPLGSSRSSSSVFMSPRSAAPRQDGAVTQAVAHERDCISSIDPGTLRKDLLHRI